MSLTLFGRSLDANTNLNIKLTSYERRVCMDKSPARPSVWTPPNTPHRSERERGSRYLLLQPYRLSLFPGELEAKLTKIHKACNMIYTKYAIDYKSTILDNSKNFKHWCYLSIISLLLTVRWGFSALEYCFHRKTNRRHKKTNMHGQRFQTTARQVPWPSFRKKKICILFYIYSVGCCQTV